MEFLSLKRLAAYCLIVTTALLVGCYATTEIEMNKENKSVDGYGSVKEIYVVRAKNDARRAIPKVMTQLEARGFKVAYLDESTPGNSQGTGFVISGDGYILTCAHVLDHATEATIKNGEERYLAEPVISDEDKDIAILKVKDKFVSKGVLGFRKQSQASIGDEISTLSYPLTSILGNDVRYSKGNINATSGLKDDVNQYQFSAQIQPGSSGGPLLDQSGEVIGMIDQTINSAKVFEETGGALPQNINFALKSGVILDYIKEKQPDLYSKLETDSHRTLSEAQRSVVKIYSGNVTQEWEKGKKLIVSVGYYYFLDLLLGYHFNSFRLNVFDMNTHEYLFSVVFKKEGMPTDSAVIHAVIDTLQRKLKGEAIQKLVY